jgi:hypothetical protein
MKRRYARQVPSGTRERRGTRGAPPRCVSRNDRQSGRLGGGSRALTVVMVRLIGTDWVGAVIMPFKVVATGRVAEAPSQLLVGDSWLVFVLDPYPGLAGVRLAHVCEVVCRSQELMSSALGSVQWGEPVEVTGELIMERIDGPPRTTSALSAFGSRRSSWPWLMARSRPERFTAHCTG